MWMIYPPVHSPSGRGTSRLLVRSHEHPSRLSARQLLPLLAVLVFLYSLTTLPVAHASEVCGNGILEGTEECDDGNAISGDGCSSTCEFDTACFTPVGSVFGNCSDPGWACYDEILSPVYYLDSVGALANVEISLAGGPGHEMLVVFKLYIDDELVGTTGPLDRGEAETLIIPALAAGRTRLQIGSYSPVGDGINSWEAVVGLPPSVTLLEFSANCSRCGNGIIDEAEECDDGNPTDGDGCSSTCDAEGGGGGDSGGDGGGGRGWWLGRPSGNRDAPASDRGVLSGLVYVDLDGDAVRDDQEQPGFRDATIVATAVAGRTAGSRHVAVVDATGRYSIELPAGTYTLSWERASSFAGFVPTTPPVAAEIEAATTTEVNFGWRDARLLRYEPCLTIDASAGMSVAEGSAMDFRKRLRTRDGTLVTRDVVPSDVLMTREAFLTLLHRTQCLPTWGDAQAIRSTLGRLVENDPRVQVLRLIDLPLDDNISEWADILYSGIAAGLRFGRETVSGLVADGHAPIRREEILDVLMDITAMGRDALGAGLPQPTPTRVGLLTGGIFPPRFGMVLNAGVTWEEGAGILARAAFANGRIDLAQPPPVVLESAASSLQWLSLPTSSSCMLRDEARPRHVRFSGTSPAAGSDYWKLRFLAAFGSPDADGHVRWLVVGDPKAEFGVREGDLSYSLDQPVTVLELLRILAVVTCHPVETETQTRTRLSGTGSHREAGTGESVFTPDRIAATQDDTSFASRLLHSVQRPLRRYNLSLTGYAPEVLRRSLVRPETPLSVADAVPFLASALLYRQVDHEVLTPFQAENRATELKADLMKHLSNGAGSSRRGLPDGAGRFTRRQLLSLLAGVLAPEYTVPESPRQSLGEAWWDWLR